MLPFDLNTPSVITKNSELEFDNANTTTVGGLTLEHLIYQNCYYLDKHTQNKVEFSTPFIAALAALILKHSTPYRYFKKYAERVINHLNNSITTNSNHIKFLNNDEIPQDIDTIAITNLFLSSEKHLITHKTDIIKTITKNRNDHYGAFNTWINRNDNNVDYFVNLNIYVLFSRLCHKDRLLENYLINNIDNYLSNGSPYYRDIGFPMFLIYFYNRHKFVKKDDRVFTSIISKLESNPHTLKFMRNIHSLHYKRKLYSKHKVEYSRFAQYFNSSSKTYHSEVLDNIIDLYLRSIYY